MKPALGWALICYSHVSPTSFLHLFCIFSAELQSKQAFSTKHLRTQLKQDIPPLRVKYLHVTGHAAATLPDSEAASGSANPFALVPVCCASFYLPTQKHQQGEQGKEHSQPLGNVFESNWQASSWITCQSFPSPCTQGYLGVLCYHKVQNGSLGIQTIHQNHVSRGGTGACDPDA